MFLKNERGYVLINVLIIIILIFSFSMMLIPKTINTSLQVDKNKGNSQAKDMAEMGINYSHAYLQSLVTQSINEAKADTRFQDVNVNRDALFCEKIKNKFKTFSTAFPRQISMTNNTNFLFQVSNPSTITFDPNTITLANTECKGFKSMTIPIKSIGKVVGKTEKPISANFVIENKAASSPISTGGSGSGTTDPNSLILTTYNTTIDISGTSVSNLLTAARFTNQVLLRGNGVLKVGGNAWFDYSSPSVEFKGNNGQVYVTGNAYFKTPVLMGGNAQNPNYMCIRGDAFLLKSGTTNVWEPYPEIKATENCPPIIKPEEQYYYDINEWGIIESNLNVIY